MIYGRDRRWYEARCDVDGQYRCFLCGDEYETMGILADGQIICVCKNAACLQAVEEGYDETPEVRD